MVRVGLDMCSKRGDIMGAIRLYELAKKGGIKLSQYHYAVLLHLCSFWIEHGVYPEEPDSSTFEIKHRSLKE